MHICCPSLLLLISALLPLASTGKTKRPTYETIVTVERDTDLEKKYLWGYTGHGKIAGGDGQMRNDDDWETLMGWACEALKATSKVHTGSDSMLPGAMSVGYSREGDLLFGSVIKGTNINAKNPNWLEPLAEEPRKDTDDLARLASNYVECKNEINKQMNRNKGESFPHINNARCGEFSVYQQYFQLNDKKPWDQGLMATTVGLNPDGTCYYKPPCGLSDHEMRQQGSAKGWGCRTIAALNKARTPPDAGGKEWTPRVLDLKPGDYTKLDRVRLVGRDVPLPSEDGTTKGSKDGASRSSTDGKGKHCPRDAAQDGTKHTTINGCDTKPASNSTSTTKPSGTLASGTKRAGTTTSMGKTSSGTKSTTSTSIGTKPASGTIMGTAELSTKVPSSATMKSKTLQPTTVKTTRVATRTPTKPAATMVTKKKPAKSGKAKS